MIYTPNSVAPWEIAILTGAVFLIPFALGMGLVLLWMLYRAIFRRKHG